MTKIEISGPRLALKNAIEAHRDAEAHCASLRASVTRIEDQLYETRGQLEAAREKDEDTKTAHVRALVAGGDVTELTRADPDAAREVERTIDACKSALAIVKTELAEVETALGYKTMRVRSLAGEVIAPKFAEVLREAEDLRHALAVKLGILTFMQGSLPSGAPELMRFRALMHQIPADPSHSAVTPWKSSHDALMRDPSAALPR